MRINTILIGIIMLLSTLPVAASDCTLEISGNANEDDTIDMQNLTHTKSIILEYGDQTQARRCKQRWQDHHSRLAARTPDGCRECGSGHGTR